MPRSVPPLETKTDGAPQIYYLQAVPCKSYKVEKVWLVVGL